MGWTCASWKPGRHGPTTQLDDACRRADVRPDARIGPDRHDPTVPDGQGARPGPGGIHRGDPATGQDEVGGGSTVIEASGRDGAGRGGRVGCADRESGIGARRGPGASRPLRRRSIRAMTTVHVLQAGYAHDRVGSSITLIRDGDALIVADPGMVASRSLILDPLAALAWRRRPSRTCS